MAIAEVSIIPLGVQSTSLSPYVAKVLEVLKDSRVEYELTAMGTIITGELAIIWQVLRKMHEACFCSDVNRVLTTIRIDDRRDKAGTPQQKVQSVLNKLSTE